jgi:YHS domain-containing protein
MNNRFLSTAALLVTFTGSVLAIAADSEPTTRPVPINKMCPVMPEEEVNPKVTVDYQGKTIGFCCRDCVAEFKKDPAKYVEKMK